MSDITTTSNRPSADALRDWNNLWAEIKLDFARIPGLDMDDFDEKAYFHALRPLAEMVVSGKIRRDDAKVYRVRFYIRGSKFRPTYDELTAALHKELGIEEVPGHVAEERKVFVKPHPLQIQGSTTARDRARQKLDELIARTGKEGARHSHGPEVWRPAYPNTPDPLENVPEELHADLIDQARQELIKTGKGRHPNNIRRTAAKIYREAQWQPQPPQEDGEGSDYPPSLVMA